METMLDYLFNAQDRILSNAASFTGTFPIHHLNKTDESVELQMSLPGYTRDDLDIRIEDERLLIETVESIKEDRFKTKFSRVFRLGNSLDTKKINAKLDNGILNVEIPKSEKAKKVSISIK